eukprot:c6258_g1_i4.p1 GENE.c6258_g1_i4~~c6258_g1_i4.p1  ORF type:complete len:211 (+),score=52.70 c6258_g1_i4:1-633(+)
MGVRILDCATEMGACLSLLSALFSGDVLLNQKAIEVKERQANQIQAEAASASVTFATHGKDTVVKGATVSGQGVAVSKMVIEQDAAYWEVIVLQPGHIAVGVAKPAAAEQLPPTLGEGTTSFGSTWGVLELAKDDVIGVCFQHSDLPMITFFLNGQPCEGREVIRVKGPVCPAVGVGESEVELRLSDFRFKPPSERFLPLMAAKDMLRAS